MIATNQLEKDSKILLVKGKAGLGNRLLCLLGSILYADITDRQLVIDWCDGAYSKKGDNAFPLYFVTPTTHNYNIADKSIFPPIWTSHINYSADELMAKYSHDEMDNRKSISSIYSADFTSKAHKDDIVVHWSYFDDIESLRPYLKGKHKRYNKLSREAILKEVWNKNLTLTPTIKSLIENFKQCNFSQYNIGVHIRYSDRKNSYKHYPKIINRILKKHPDSNIFLSTDNRDVEKEFKYLFKNITITKKWLPEPGTPVHRNKHMASKYTIGSEALIDIYLLAECDFLIYDKTTTFGYCASIISKATSNNIFEMSPISHTIKSKIKSVYNRIRLAL